MSETDLLGAPVRTNPSTLLTTLALIQVGWDKQSRSYLDQFVPFVLEVLRSDSTKVWSDSQVRNGLIDQFGLKLPIQVVGSLLGRAANNQEVIRKNRQYSLSRQADVASRRPIGALRADCLRRQRSLVDALVAMVDRDFGLKWSLDIAEAALASFIEEHSVPLLAVSERGDAFDISDYSNSTDYVVSTFVCSIVEKQPQLFACLDEMVKGSMLASALYMAVPNVDMRFHRTTLYIDTPLGLQVLGFEGDEAKQAVQQVLDMARAQGAGIACFEHTVSEMKGVLEAALASIRMGSVVGSDFAVADRFRQIGATPSDVEKDIARLRQSLNMIGIAIRETPQHSLYLGVDEDALDEMLQKRVKYRNKSALTRDLDSLTAIHRLRGGFAPKELERCKALLVTSNSSLVHVARDFFDRARHQWPLAMSDNDIAALLWVKQPQQFPNVPRTQVVADCIAALSPSSDIWEAVLKEAERLASAGAVNEQDIVILRSAPEAHRAIMDATLGEPHNVNEKTVLEAVQRTKEQINEPLKKQLESAQTKIADTEKHAVQLEYSKLELQSRMDEQEAELDSLKQGQSLVRDRIHSQAVAAAKRILAIVTGVIVVILVGCVVVMTLDLGVVSKWASGIIGVLSVLTALFGAVTKRVSKLEKTYERWSEQRRLKAVGLG